MPSDKNLPPLNALRAFEAAGRHLSLTKAAEELHVTPAAVSHQVKALEDFLGVALFRRVSRSLLLTDAGQACLPALREGFDKLAEAVAAVRSVGHSRPLVVTVAPSFGAKWLVPRLDHFTSAHPDIEVRIDASMRVVDLLREDVDVAVRYGRGQYPRMRVECLLAEEVVPVCSPKLLQGPHGLRAPSDLCHHTLLHVIDPLPGQGGVPDWGMWLKAAGVHACNPNRGPTFTIASMAMEAAIDGQGVALIGSVIVADDLAAGRLVKPFEMSFPIQFCYYVVYAERMAQEPRVSAFRTWLFEEARMMEHSEAGGADRGPTAIG